MSKQTFYIFDSSSISRKNSQNNLTFTWLRINPIKCWVVAISHICAKKHRFKSLSRNFFNHFQIHVIFCLFLKLFWQNWDCYSLHHCWELRTEVLSSCRMQCDLLSAAKPQNARAKRYFDGFWRFDFTFEFRPFWRIFGSFWDLETLRKRCPPVSASKIIMIAAARLLWL